MQRNNTKGHSRQVLRQINRRQLLVGAGATTVAGSLATMGLTQQASAQELLTLPSDLRREAGGWEAVSHRHPVPPAPLPIPGGIDAPPVGFIHWFLPGPEDAETPFLKIPGFGLNVEPSTLTNFKGYTAFAVVSGRAKGSDGKDYDVEFDVRAMKGEYIVADGSKHTGTFALF
ncbi:twin-arginine translocation signal domain-containing protein [Chloroflexi bacterium TSY]|nr:twin-arginine translocation signal domain-containing protein [Chloroflexi bacterium TSY]